MKQGIKKMEFDKHELICIFEQNIKRFVISRTFTFWQG